MITKLKQYGVKSVLLTGDHENAASRIAKQTGIDEVHANCLPEDKLIFIDNCQEKKENICMIGDGIRY